MSLDEFKNLEYKTKVRQTFFELLRYQPDVLEGLGVKTIQEFIEECSIQFASQLWKHLPNSIVTYIQVQGDEAVGND